MFRVVVVAVSLMSGAIPANADVMRDACLASERSPGPATCQCVQRVADRMLSRGDQKLAARVILKPDLYIEFKYGSRSRQNFLDRYKNWGQASEEACRG